MDFVISYGAWVLTPLHVLVCLVLIAVVLLQTGKGTDWGGMLGGSGTQTAFGPRSVENTLSRLTKIAAVIFMITSLSLSLLPSKSRRGGDLFKDLPAAEKKAPATPAVPSPGASPVTTNPIPLSPSDAIPVEPAATPGAPSPAPVTSPAGQ